MESDKHERIRIRAHRIWDENGRPEGQARAHWEQARREVEAEDEAEPRPQTQRTEPSSPEMPSTAPVAGDPSTVGATMADVQGDLAEHKRK